MSYASYERPVPESRKTPLYLFGLIPDNSATTPTTQLVVNIGVCSDSNGTIDMVSESKITIDATVQGVNGIDNTNTLTASSLYYVYLLGDSSKNFPTAAIISLNDDGPLMPYGYDCWRLIGIKITGGASTFLTTYTLGQYSNRTFVYDAPISVVSATAKAAFTAVSLNQIVAPIGTPIVNFRVSFTPAATADKLILRPTGSSAVAGYATLTGEVISIAKLADLTCPAFIDTSGHASFDYKTNAAATAVASIYVKSFTYNV
jgi:hypothetical protein